MKIAIYALSALLSLNLSAYATTNTDNQFSGNYGHFIVSYDSSTGKVKLADTHVRKIYSANARTGQEFPLDIEFLQFARDSLIQQYADYLLSATVSAQMNSTGAIDFIIKAKANFDGGTEPQVVLIFNATSRAAKNIYTYNNYGYGNYSFEIKTIESDLRFDRVESPQGGPLSGSASIYKMLLSLISKLWPSEGIHSTISQYDWY